MAWILARWDASSGTAFVARMNATARHLGLPGTHYTELSGLASSTQQHRGREVGLGVAAMRQPTLPRPQYRP